MKIIIKKTRKKNKYAYDSAQVKWTSYFETLLTCCKFVNFLRLSYGLDKDYSIFGKEN